MYIWTVLAVLIGTFLLKQFPWIAAAPFTACSFTYRLVYHGSYILIFDLRARWNFRAAGEPPQKGPVFSSSEDALSQLEPLVYSPLPSERHIRLLKLQRPTRQTRRDNIISCELVPVSLDQPKLLRGYRAISYTWDGQPCDRVVICNGKKLLVTKNCEDILRHAFRLARLFIWIDAICIDQSNSTEKATQVPLMSEIYRQALQVNVWLGVPSYGDELCFHYAWLQWCVLAAPKMRKSILERRLLRFIEDRGHSKYISQLLRKSWWRRVWTVQESVLTPSSSWASLTPVLVNCGNYEIPLECLSGFLLHFCTAYNMFLHVSYIFNDSPWSTALTLHYPHRAVTASKKLNIHHLMFQIRICDATDQRDRVYGLYGILQNAGINLPKPSYHKTIKEIFLEFTIAVCNSLRSLELLEITTGLVSDENRSEMPSWVPNYAEPHRTGDFMHSPHAAGDSQASFKFLQHGCILKTYGIIVDTIKAQSNRGLWKVPPDDSGMVRDNLTVNLGSESDARATIEAYRDWCKIAEACTSMDAYPNVPQCMHAFGQAMTAGNMKLLEGLTRGLVSVAGWMLLLYRGPHRIDQLNQAFEALKIAPEFDFDTKMRFTRCDELMTLWALKTNPGTAMLTHAVWMMMREKTVFSTARGFIGSAHSSVKVGDVITLIPGVGRPMVLRPKGLPGIYEVVGPALIEGMMNGEQWHPEDLEEIQLV
ncbi:heterokaryon incompatibility protein-domain-containing protein [Bisporella sp. PMI_857]|nr:heterokaryon incompatibility protein-domain-containing protein [Bisporella sp. PMI_857]